MSKLEVIVTKINNPKDQDIIYHIQNIIKSNLETTEGKSTMGTCLKSLA